FVLEAPVTPVKPPGPPTCPPPGLALQLRLVLLAHGVSTGSAPRPDQIVEGGHRLAALHYLLDAVAEGLVEDGVLAGVGVGEQTNGRIDRCLRQHLRLIRMLYVGILRPPR